MSSKGLKSRGEPTSTRESDIESIASFGSVSPTGNQRNQPSPVPGPSQEQPIEKPKRKYTRKHQDNKKPKTDMEIADDGTPLLIPQTVYNFRDSDEKKMSSPTLLGFETGECA